MSSINDVRTPGLSRRRLVLNVAIYAGGVALAGGILAAAPASAKISQKGVSYQTTPKGAARCDSCKLWQPADACKLVAGVISPAGWCTLYANKA